MFYHSSQPTPGSIRGAHAGMVAKAKSGQVISSENVCFVKMSANDEATGDGKGATGITCSTTQFPWAESLEF